MNISDKIKHLRTTHGLTQVEFGKIAGVSDKAVSTWEAGLKEPRMGAVKRIAEHFHLTINELVDDNSETTTPYAKNILPLPRFTRRPRLGAIACGKPILAVEDADEFDDVPEGVECDFTLLCKGDSMISARIFDGDVVYIRQQPEVENGQIAAVLIGDEATLKRVYYAPNGGRITLRACNPLYPDMEYEGEDLNQIQILGLAVGFYSTIRHIQ